MLAAYGVDVLDPAVSVRRVHVLLERLPPSARNGGELWSTEAELLAHVIDSVRELTWLTASAHGNAGARPKPVDRPPLRGQGEHAAPAAAQPSQRAQLNAGGEVKAGSWAEAGLLIAGLSGVRVHDG
jgi:hypothetical protein